jgi:hypothetical protein
MLLFNNLVREVIRLPLKIISYTLQTDMVANRYIEMRVFEKLHMLLDRCDLKVVQQPTVAGIFLHTKTNYFISCYIPKY